MAKSPIENPLDPKSLTVTINSNGATGNLQAFKIGRLVFVTGVLTPTITGVNLALATIYGVKVINSYMKTQIGGYNGNSQEMNFIPSGNNTNLEVNTTTISDLKINACFIATH